MNYTIILHLFSNTLFPFIIVNIFYSMQLCMSFEWIYSLVTMHRFYSLYVYIWILVPNGMWFLCYLYLYTRFIKLLIVFSLLLTNMQELQRPWLYVYLQIKCFIGACNTHSDLTIIIFNSAATQWSADIIYKLYIFIKALIFFWKIVFL